MCTAALRDRFGEHGWTGLAILKRAEDESCWIIDTFLISCRVLGRHFEQAFANACIGCVRSVKPLPLRATFNPGPQNAQVRDFLDSMGFQRIAERADGGREYLLEDSSATPNLDYVEITWETS